jgi:hypothetical protein
VKGGNIVHVTEPHYLLTPDQYDVLDGTRSEMNHSLDGANLPSTGNATSTTTTSSINDDNGNNKPSTTRSRISAHATSNYLQGISRESQDHPLTTDLPPSVKAFLGEKVIG